MKTSDRKYNERPAVSGPSSLRPKVLLRQSLGRLKS